MSNYRVLNPNNFYSNIDFETIKNNIKISYPNVIDYGSIISIENASSYISVNRLGKFEIFIKSDKEEIDNTIDEIVKLFKSQVEDFALKSYQ